MLIPFAILLIIKINPMSKARSEFSLGLKIDKVKRLG